METDSRFRVARCLVAVAVPVLAWGCGASRERPDAGGSDGGTTLDAGPVDAGEPACSTEPAEGNASTLSYTKLAVGTTFSCGLTGAAEIRCWGDDSFGQLTPPAGAYASIAVGTFFACAMASDGSLRCWGSNEAGERDPPSTEMSDVALGFSHGCGIVQATRELTCWGDVAAPPAGTYQSVVSGFGFSCALPDDGLPTCWGDNDEGQTDAPAVPLHALTAKVRTVCGLDESDQIVCWGADSIGQVSEAPEGGFEAVSMGVVGCALGADDSVQCWPSAQGVARDAPGDCLDEVGSGGRFACGLRPDGIVVCWGDDNADGEQNPP